MAASTIPAFLVALEAALRADAGMTGVYISQGIPKAADPGKELLCIGDVDGEQTAAALGRLRRTETYSVEVIVSVIRGASDQRLANARALALVSVIESVLRANPTMSSTVLVAQIGGPFKLSQHSDDDQREGRVTVTIACQARI